MATAEAPARDIAGEQVASIIALLDAAKNSPCDIKLWADRYENGIAEHAVRLWASANATPLTDRTHEYPDDGYSIRTLSIQLHANNYSRGEVTVQWNSVPLTLPQPVPGVVIRMPRIARIEEPEEPASLDEAAARFSLLELD